MLPELQIAFLPTLDIDKYANGLLNHPVQAIREPGVKYWTAPTVEEKENFHIWRKDSFEGEKKYSPVENPLSPLSDEAKKQKELQRIGGRIEKLYYAELSDLLNGSLTEQYYKMACLLGLIDYLKYLNNSNFRNRHYNSNVDNVQLSQKQIALICFYDRISVAEYLREVPPRKLKDEYSAILDRQARIGLEKKAPNGSNQASINKLERIRSVIPLLNSPEGIATATDEANILEKRIDADSE